jgi:hypothetical protein
VSDKKPFFMMPVMLIAVILAVVFFQVRKRFAAPAVPLPVAATIGHFLPEVGIGSRIDDASKHLSDVRWVPQLGYVGTLKDGGPFVQVRLYPDSATRRKSGGDVKARVQQVEFISTSQLGMGRVFSDLVRVFRNNEPLEGCITSVSVQRPPNRSVLYWLTKSDQGGVALVYDWDTTFDGKPAPMLMSMIAWAGPFQGSPQLHAAFEKRRCTDSTSAGDPRPDDATEAVETLNLAFRDSVAEFASPVRQAATPVPEQSAPIATPMTAQACSDPGRLGPTQLHTTTLVDIDLPDDFKLTNTDKAEADAERTGYARYEWRGSDNSRLSIYPTSAVHSGWTGLIDTECDLNIDGHNVHVDIANASTAGADFVVHGFFQMEAGSPVAYIAHARSHRRQEELLHAMRTIAIKPRWGSRRVE